LRALFKLLKASDSVCKMSVKTLTRKIHNTAVSKRVTLRNDLKNCLGYGLTFDLWTSPSGLQYVSLIVHYSSEDFENKEGLLDFIEVGSDHSGEALAHYIFESL
jgi:hypothetical protein